MKEDMQFEEAMKQLENITNELERGDLDLDTSLVKFEEGMKLSKKCNEILQNAEKKITILTEKNGEIQEEKFNPLGEENKES
ncbi:MAG: exodeoxyribonuclease VII small subunit [Clostridia bacterium]